MTAQVLPVQPLRPPRPRRGQQPGAVLVTLTLSLSHAPGRRHRQAATPTVILGPPLSLQQSHARAHAREPGGPGSERAYRHIRPSTASLSHVSPRVLTHSPDAWNKKDMCEANSLTVVFRLKKKVFKEYTHVKAPKFYGVCVT